MPFTQHAARHTRLALSPVDAFGLAPEGFEVVEVSGLVGEDVDDDVDEVQEERLIGLAPSPASSMASATARIWRSLVPVPMTK
jgi:hypothetical protein